MAEPWIDYGKLFLLGYQSMMSRRIFLVSPKGQTIHQ